MDPQWLFEKLGVVGVMLGAMFYDRKRLLDELAKRDARIEELTARLLENDASQVRENIERELTTLAHLQSILQLLEKWEARQ